MDSLTAGAFVGAGSFRCARCDYALTLEASDVLPQCPGCGGREFARASLFSTERIPAGETSVHAGSQALPAPVSPEHAARLAAARERIHQPGEYLCFEDGEELRTVALTREWTRIGRSLAADVRFDDPTVSRRHALIVRHPDGVRLLDDRSLNGVFVNGSRVDGKALRDGDEIVVGRYRLSFMSISADSAELEPASAAAASSLDPIA
ncbi:MAG TPA: FHA domain-containing protein [Solirubrobacteraceae bacterium]|nr:FHA domain-containing protein [Solirubrobacteraceae bacterium]